MNNVFFFISSFAFWSSVKFFCSFFLEREKKKKKKRGMNFNDFFLFFLDE